jgi:serine/threonine-protein kinase PknG
MSTDGSGRCGRPGCGGSYAADGYCDRCGHRARASVAAARTSTEDIVDPPEARDVPATRRSAPVRLPRRRSGSAPELERVAELDTVPDFGPRHAVTQRIPRRARGEASTLDRPRVGARGRLGAGIVDMPTIPSPDPRRAVLSDPQVRENQRFCGSCGRPVGRGRSGRPAVGEGFCPQCRTPFSFLPDLAAGDVVDGRFEIVGCLAHGGQGWIYLARHMHLGDSEAERWVCLKGLITPDDPEAREAAVAERRFLVRVDHPSIVDIQDLVTHPHVSGALRSYIVMEYVGGRSLRELIRRRRASAGRTDPLPLPQVIIYGLETLQALSYLHDRELLFCDIKPDNIIHCEDRIKLIDLGAVRYVDDDVSTLYGTPGYEAPELEQSTGAASVRSDLYSVGRLLAELSADLPKFSSDLAHRLPTPAEEPLFAQEESLYQFLLRATAHDPQLRFGSATEMSEQLFGVLRQCMARRGEPPKPLPSLLFTGERRAFGTEDGAVVPDAAGPGPRPGRVAAALPLPQIEVLDTGAGKLDAMMAALSAPAQDGVEVTLQHIRAAIEQGQPPQEATLTALRQRFPHEWRIDWYRGLAALAGGDPAGAVAAFTVVYRWLPGELAPQLALAAAAECAGEPGLAARYYERVWRTDHTYVSAAFGFGRALRTVGEGLRAVAILDEVPDSSSHHVAAQIAALRALLDPRGGALDEDAVIEAGRRAQRVFERRISGEEWLTIEVLSAALDWVLDPGRPAADRRADGTVLGRPLTEHALRAGLEDAYRRLAKATQEPRRRIALVERANQVRPTTWW